MGGTSASRSSGGGNERTGDDEGRRRVRSCSCGRPRRGRTARRPRAESESPTATTPGRPESPSLSAAPRPGARAPRSPRHRRTQKPAVGGSAWTASPLAPPLLERSSAAAPRQGNGSSAPRAAPTDNRQRSDDGSTPIGVPPPTSIRGVELPRPGSGSSGASSPDSASSSRPWSGLAGGPVGPSARACRTTSRAFGARLPDDQSAFGAVLPDDQSATGDLTPDDHSAAEACARQDRGNREHCRAEHDPDTLGRCQRLDLPHVVPLAD